MLHVVFIGVQIQVETMDRGEKYTLIGYISDDCSSNDGLPDLDYRPMARTKQTPRGRGGRGGRGGKPPPRKQPDSSSVEEISSSDTEPFTRDNDDPSWSPGKRTPVKEWGVSGTPIKKQVKRRRHRRQRGGRYGGAARAARALPIPPAPAPAPAPPRPQMPWPAPGMNLPWPVPVPQPRPPAPVPQPRSPAPAPQPRPPAPVPQPRPPAPVPQPRPPAPAPLPPPEPPAPLPGNPTPVPDIATPSEPEKRPDPKEPPSVGTTPERPTTPTRRPDPKEPPSTGATPERPGTPKGVHPWAIVLHQANPVLQSPVDGPWKLREDMDQSGTVVVRQVIDKITRVGSTPPGHRKPDPNEPVSVGGTPERREPSTPDGDPPASPVSSFSSADPGLPDDFSSPDSENNQGKDPPTDPPADPPADPDNPLIVPRRDPQREARRRQQQIHRPPLITPPKPKPGKKRKMIRLVHPVQQGDR